MNKKKKNALNPKDRFVAILAGGKGERAAHAVGPGVVRRDLDRPARRRRALAACEMHGTARVDRAAARVGLQRARSAAAWARNRPAVLGWSRPRSS